MSDDAEEKLRRDISRTIDAIDTLHSESTQNAIAFAIALKRCESAHPKPVTEQDLLKSMRHFTNAVNHIDLVMLGLILKGFAHFQPDGNDISYWLSPKGRERGETIQGSK